jgi:hypothetical protein
MKVTIQIVEVENGSERHVKKVTLAEITGQEVLLRIQEYFAGHMVSRKKKAENARDRRQK